MHRIIRRYPRLILYALTIAASYLLYRLGYLDWIQRLHSGGSSLALISAGILFSFGFTAAFGCAIFVELAHITNPLIGAALGGAGSLIADLTILTFVQEHLGTEIRQLKQSWLFRTITGVLFHHRFPHWLRELLLWIIAAIVIASPLPDEIGVTLVGGLEHIDRRLFAILCFVLNAVGIWAILMIARAG